MNKDELEKFLQGGTETQRGEIKRDINWDVKIFARSILALLNVRDGGFIIIGVEDNFNRLGVNETIIESYKIDEMRDQQNLWKMKKWSD